MAGWSHASSMPPSDTASSSSFPFTPPPPVLQDTHVQMDAIAQAWHHLSTLMSEAGFPSGQVALPPPQLTNHKTPAHPWPPPTSMYQHLPSSSERKSLEESSFSAGPLTIAKTPLHHNMHRSFGSTFSSGTFPPSSPTLSSRVSSPDILPNAARSKSRGRPASSHADHDKMSALASHSRLKTKEFRVPSIPDAQDLRAAPGRKSGPSSLYERHDEISPNTKTGKVTRKGKERG